MGTKERTRIDEMIPPFVSYQWGVLAMDSRGRSLALWKELFLLA